ENAADKYHGVVKFDVVSGVQAKAVAGAPSYTSVYAKALGGEMARDEKVVAITAAMPSGTGLDKVAEAFPDRTFDVGIAEQHAVALHGSSPIAVRYPRGDGRGVPLPLEPQALEIGKGRLVREGKTVAILSLGTRLEEAEKAADELEAKGLSTTVADLRFAKPL